MFTENGLFFMETSAKTAANVNELFTDIARRYLPEPPRYPLLCITVASDTQRVTVQMSAFVKRLGCIPVIMFILLLPSWAHRPLSVASWFMPGHTWVSV